MKMSVVAYTLIAFILNLKGIYSYCPSNEEAIFNGADTAPVPPTYFLLYTRQNPNFPQNLSTDSCLEESNYNPNLKTVFILDGYYGSPSSEHIMFLKLVYLYYEDCNVIIVDWSIGASENDIIKAIRNTLIVGKYVGELLDMLKQNCNRIDLANVHVIGFSLGGQTAGFIGKYTKSGKIGRITGLDIAGLCYRDFSAEHKLYQTDANFVDVISTSSYKEEINDQPTGHVYFKPDGGKIARGCGDEVADSNNSDLIFGCSHFRAVYLFASSLYTQCLLVGYQCKNKDTFNSGQCYECGADGKNCAALGIQAEKYTDKTINGTITMYLATTYTDQYCLYQYHVEVTLDSDSPTVLSYGKLVLIINNGAVIAILNNNLYVQGWLDTFQEERTYKYLMITTKHIDQISDISFLWYSTTPHLNTKLNVKCIKIIPMNNLETDRSSMTLYATTNGQSIPADIIMPLNVENSC